MRPVHGDEDHESARGRACATRSMPGRSVLSDGGSAIDAVEAAVRVLEDDPCFNAGRGSTLNAEGLVELDAAIMDGANRRAGAVAGVRTTRAPISLARTLMERGPHVFLSYDGADRLAREAGLEQVENGWFVTGERRRQLDELLAKGGFDSDVKYGTVGAVAVDWNGHVAAATSTGGLTAKQWGRIGDSPLIGAGTYADDRSAAVSATGSGEYFIRAVAGAPARRAHPAWRGAASGGPRRHACRTSRSLAAPAG